MATNPAPFDTIPWDVPAYVQPDPMFTDAERIRALNAENNKLAKELAQYKMLYRTASADAEAAQAALDRTVDLLANSRMKRRNLKEAYRSLQEAYNKLRRELDNYFAETIANG